MDKDTLMEKWLRGELSEAEQKQFAELEEADLNMEIVRRAKQFKNQETPKSFDAFKAAYQAKHKTKNRTNWWRPMLRIAAVVLVTLGLYFTIFSNTDKTVKTLAGEQSEIVLPDNSQVVVNAQSMLSYNAKHWKDNRVVDLNGEAYFKVAKGTTFDVNTPSGQVTVVGTQFNVKQRHDYFEVTCYEGSVKVSSNNYIELLKQGDVYRMIAGEYLQIKTTSKAPQWTQAISSFAKVPLAEVLAELERQYGVEVAPNGIDLDRLFTGGFTHQNLDEALTAITQPMGLKYTVESDKRVKVYAQ